MATRPDTTNLRPAAKSCLSYANDPVGLGGGSTPPPLSTDFRSCTVPVWRPQPTHIYHKSLLGTKLVCGWPQGGRNTAEGLLTVLGLPKTHLQHMRAATHTIMHIHAYIDLLCVQPGSHGRLSVTDGGGWACTDPLQHPSTPGRACRPWGTRENCQICLLAQILGNS